MLTSQKKTLYWQKCQGDVWCNLLKLNLEHEHFDNMEGVYVIWHAGTSPKTVYVGQGIIKNCLKRHKEEEEILKFQNYNLYVTWANVTSDHRDGVEKYLINQLSPLLGERAPDTDSIEVNLPW
ncbi:MAG TPA: hypothetical protein VIK14_04825 [Ignavibacteria bacterium]